MTRTKEEWDKVFATTIQGQFTLGLINSESLLKDPKHVGFMIARYKFAARMMSRCRHIIELGCGEGIGTLMFLAETSATVTAIDFDEPQIEYAKQQVLPHGSGRLSFLCQDLISTPYIGNPGDGLVSLDVVEHVDPSEEEQFLRNCTACLEQKGIAVFGTPNKYAEPYASDRSRQGHINLFDPERLISTLEAHFDHVFLFSMNDEMVHTGYHKLAHYLMALCVK